MSPVNQPPPVGCCTMMQSQAAGYDPAVGYTPEPYPSTTPEPDVAGSPPGSPTGFDPNAASLGGGDDQIAAAITRLLGQYDRDGDAAISIDTEASEEIRPSLEQADQAGNGDRRAEAPELGALLAALAGPRPPLDQATAARSDATSTLTPSGSGPSESPAPAPTRTPEPDPQPAPAAAAASGGGDSHPEGTAPHGH